MDAKLADLIKNTTLSVEKLKKWLGEAGADDPGSQEVMMIHDMISRGVAYLTLLSESMLLNQTMPPDKWLAYNRGMQDIFSLIKEFNELFQD